MQITPSFPRVVRPGILSLLAASLLSYAVPSWAAPPALRRVHVLQLTSSRQAEAGEAIRFTHALELKVTSASNVRFVNTTKKLLRLLDDAKCGRSFADRALYESPPLDAHADQLLDVACLQKLAELTDTPPAERYLWGWLYDAGDGKLNVSVHLWQKDLPDRSVSLPYDPATVEQTARRAVLKLLDSERVGDVTLTAPERIQNGSLYVDDAFYGPWDSAHPDTTVATGNHSFEVRTARGAWRVNAVVVAGQVRPISLTTGALATSTNAPPAVPPKDTSSSNVFPWTLVGVGALGVVGTAVFVPQWLSANSDVNDRCTSDVCPLDSKDARDRRSRNGTLSLVSAGAIALGVVGGVLLWSRASKEAKGPVAATVTPMLGGAAANVAGRF